VRQHGGYVLVQRKPDDFMLHESSCGHLELTAGFTLSTRPRRWSKTQAPLIAWAEGAVERGPSRCASCM
jgi:hypothetical protein